MRNYHKSCWQSKTASIVYFVWQNVKYRYGKKCCIFAMRQKCRYGSEILREWHQIINIKSQKISNPCCNPFLKHSQGWTPQSIPPRIELIYSPRLISFGDAKAESFPIELKSPTLNYLTEVTIYK